MSRWNAPFESFGATHLVVVVSAALVCVACGVVASRERVRGGRAFADGFAGVVLGWNLLGDLWWVMPGNWDLGVSLPLHVCDLTNLVLPFAIWTRNRVLLAVTVLWGLGLSSQAFVTPTLTEPPEDLRFWLFWAAHTNIAAGCFVIAGGIDFRPGWRDWRLVTVVGVVVLAALMVFNHLAGTNYGYVAGTHPSRPTLIDHLGPWPQRVVWLFLIAAAAQAVVVVLYPALAGFVRLTARGVTRR